MAKINIKQTIEDRLDFTKGLIYYKSSNWFDVLTLRRKKSLQSFNQLMDYCLENYDDESNCKLMDDINDYVICDERNHTSWLLRVLDNFKSDKDLLLKTAEVTSEIALSQPFLDHYLLAIQEDHNQFSDYTNKVLDILRNTNTTVKYKPGMPIQLVKVCYLLEYIRKESNETKFNLLHKFSDDPCVALFYDYTCKNMDLDDKNLKLDDVVYFVKNILIHDKITNKGLRQFITGSFFKELYSPTLNQLVTIHEKAKKRSLEEFNPNSTIIIDKRKYQLNIHELLKSAEKVRKITNSEETANEFLQSYLHDNIVYSKRNTDTLYLIMEILVNNYNQYSNAKKDALELMSSLSKKQQSKLENSYKEIVTYLNKIPESKHPEEALNIFLYGTKNYFHNLGFNPGGLLDIINSLNKTDLVEDNYDLIVTYSNQIYSNIDDSELRTNLNIKDIDNILRTYWLGYNNLMLSVSKEVKLLPVIKRYRESFFSSLNEVVSLGDEVNEKRSGLNQWCNKVYESIIKDSNDGWLYMMLMK